MINQRGKGEVKEGKKSTPLVEGGDKTVIFLGEKT